MFIAGYVIRMLCNKYVKKPHFRKSPVEDAVLVKNGLNFLGEIEMLGKMEDLGKNRNFAKQSIHFE